MLLAALLIGGGLSLCSLITATWQLWIFFGVIAGIGFSVIFVAPTSTVTRWFVERRGLAVGITISGLGFGLLVIPPITERIIWAYDWQTGFIFLGVLAFVLNVIVGIFIQGKPENMGLTALGASKDLPSSRRLPANAQFSISETIRTKAFWLIYLMGTFAFAAQQMIIVHIVPYSGTLGNSPFQASLGLSFLGIGNIIGRLVSGVLSDRIGRLRTLVMCTGIQAIATLALLSIGVHYLLLYFIMLFLGFGFGGGAIMSVVILGEYFGLKNVGAVIGIYFTTGIPAGFLGPLMAGVIFDATQSYFLAIVIAGAICVMAVILTLLIRPVYSQSNNEATGIGTAK